MQAFSPAVRDIFESFEFHTQIDKLAKSGLLSLVTDKFANIDLHPAAVSNAQMGAVFEVTDASGRDVDFIGSWMTLRF